MSHHLEFDAGIIMHELERCGLQELTRRWTTIVQNGFCTMDPTIGRWLRVCFGQDCGTERTKNVFGLSELVEKLVEGGVDMLKKHHDAGADAQMHRLLYINMLDLAKRAANRMLQIEMISDPGEHVCSDSDARRIPVRHCW